MSANYSGRMNRTQVGQLVLGPIFAHQVNGDEFFLEQHEQRLRIVVDDRGRGRVRRRRGRLLLLLLLFLNGRLIDGEKINNLRRKVEAYVRILALYDGDGNLVRIVDARTTAAEYDIGLIVAARLDQTLVDRLARIRTVDDIRRRTARTRTGHIGQGRDGRGLDGRRQRRSRTQIPQYERAVRVRRGHTLSMLIEHGRLELLLRLIDLFDLIFNKVEYNPQAALIGD